MPIVTLSPPATRRGLRVRVTFSGDLERRFELLKQRGKDLSRPMRRVATLMLRSTNQNFRAEGRRDGASGVWPKLTPTTIARRKKDQRGRPKILQASGRLKNSITPTSGPFFAAVGTTVEYAGDHQQGGRFGAAKRIRRTVRIPPHLSTRRVRPGAKAKKPGRLLSELSDGSQAALRVRARKRAIGSAATLDPTGKLSKKGRRGRAILSIAQKTILERGGRLKTKVQRLKRGRKPRNLVKVPVKVRAHTQRQDYVLRARPFLFLHRADVRRYGKVITDFIVKATAA